MPQLFSPGANTKAKLTLTLLAILPVAVLFGGSLVSRSPVNTSVGVARNQPVPFSHKHHVKELGLDCRFCHVSVEKSKFASVPPSETCMTCHSQIWTNSPALEPMRKSFAEGTPVVWEKVNKLPEFVYFDHSIHIGRGLNCNTCHGAVQDMQMTAKGHSFSMSWCLECHREPEKYLRKSDAGGSAADQAFELYRKMQLNPGEMTPRELQLMEGNARSEDPKDIAEGEALLTKYKVNKKQLMDCWICHR